jgi:hypothetical protein
MAEEKLGDKTLQEHFREHAELIDRLVTYRLDKTLQEHFREQAALFDQLLIHSLDELDKRWDAKLDAKLDGRLKPIRSDLAAVKHAVKVILERLP